MLEPFLKKMVSTIHKFISEGIDLNKSNKSKECDICHYWYFLDKNFNYEPYLCNGCHDLIQKAKNFNDVAIVSIKRRDYGIQFWYINKSDANNLLNNSVLDNKRVLQWIVFVKILSNLCKILGSFSQIFVKFM